MNPTKDAREIFDAAVARVDPEAMIRNSLTIEGDDLVVDTGLESARYHLSDYGRIRVVGAGKASGKMARAIESLLGDRIEDGLVAVKDGQTEPLARIRMVEAGHPVPDARSVEAAKSMLAMAAECAESEARGIRCLAIVLVSGGGSALLCAPAEGLDLAEKAATTKLLLASGATIQEMNAVRKHLSAVKGGRLARAFAPSDVLALLLSDVVGDDLDVIASGPCTPDSSTWEDAKEVLVRRGVMDRLPRRIADHIESGCAGKIEDTPKAGDPGLATTKTILIGTNRLALLAAEKRARELGYSTLSLSSRITGEAREIALVYAGIAEDIAASGFPLKAPACLVAGGETTVTLRGSGKGGRNQEMALAFLDAMSRGRVKRGTGGEVFLSGGTDGNDGPTDAAGAWASAGILAAASARGLDPAQALADNDSYAFFDASGGLVKTGPTGTNVCDIQVLIVP